MTPLIKGYVVGVVGVAIWSTTGVIMSYLIIRYDMPALLLAFWRNVLVCIALAPTLWLIRRSLLTITLPQVAFYAVAGLILALLNSTWALSVRENGAAVATVLSYCSAGFTALLAWRLFRERLGAAKLGAVALTLVGCLLVSGAYRAELWLLNPLGIATGLLSGLLFASHTLVGKEAARRGLNPWTLLFYAFGFGSLAIAAFNLMPILPGAAGSIFALWPALPPDGWMLLLLLSFVPTLLGYGLYNLSMHYLPASIANILATMEPAMTAIQAYIVLDERLTPVQVVGGVVILAAVLLAQRQSA